MVSCVSWKVVCSNVVGLRKWTLEEAHGFLYIIHQGLTNIYHDLSEVFWWGGFKKDIAEFVVKCPNCQQMKAEN